MVKRNSSLGVLISTLVFFFAGLWLILEGKALFEDQETSKGIFFSTSISGWWLLLSLIHASISYYVCYYSYTNSVDQIIFGSCVQFIVVIMCI